MTFKILSWLMTLAGCALGIRFMFAGASVLKEWGIQATDGALVMCRRIGAVYLGLALLFFLGRTAGPSELRSAVCIGIGAASALLACLGFFESWAGRATSGIIVPAIVETLLAAGFAWAWWTGRAT
jgi:hypothetical protein